MKYALVAALLLSGCITTSPEQRAENAIAKFGPYCDKLGFARDTDGWRTCVAGQDGHARTAAIGMIQATQANRAKNCTTVGANTTCN